MPFPNTSPAAALARDGCPHAGCRLTARRDDRGDAGLALRGWVYHPLRRHRSAITLGGCSVRWSADRPRPRVGPLAILGVALLLIVGMMVRPDGPAQAAADVGGPLPGLSP